MQRIVLIILCICYLMLPYGSQIYRSERPIYAVYAACHLGNIRYPTKFHDKSTRHESLRMTSWL